MRLPWLGPIGAILVPVVVALAYLAGLPAPPASEDVFSFEADLQGWTPDATDLAFGNCTGGSGGNCTLAWAIERTTELAHDGVASVRMSLDNLNDAGKIWIERAFDAAPGQLVHVHVSFAFASADYGSVNHWTILAGALPVPPVASAELAPVVRGDTGNGLGSPGGYAWLEKAYDSAVRADADGHVWAVIGVWGTWETPRTYYVDAVRVVVSPV